MKLTAMNLLIRQVEVLSKRPNISAEAWQDLRQVMLNAQHLLKEEKNQLAQAFDDGEWNGCPSHTAEDHYQENYK
jgi:hypothetical protein